MKTFKQTVLAIATLGLVSFGYGQEENDQPIMEKEYKNQFFMLPTSLADQIVQFGYERKFSNSNSAMLQLGMYLEGTDVLQDPRVNGTGIRVEGNYNMIFDNMSTKKNHEVNFYLSPYVNYFNAKFVIGKDYYNEEYASNSDLDSLGNWVTTYTEDTINNDVSSNVNHFGLGATIGIRWTISKRLVFDAYTGGGAQLANYVGDNKFRRPLRDQFIGNFTSQGVLGRAGIRVGVMF